MITKKRLETLRLNIRKVNESGKNRHYGKNNPKWNEGNRIVGLWPCPTCHKPLKREKRYALLNCKKCANKSRKIRGSYKSNKTRSAYYWEARKLVERSGITLTPDNHVHHINGNWKDNRIENLIVTTKWEHRRKYHHK